MPTDREDDEQTGVPLAPRGGSAPRAALATGEPFGSRYHIIRLLGIGGMGAVYQAWDEELGVAIALKVIRPEATADPAAAQDMERRFKRELLLARQVTHPNVVRIHDLGELDGIKYISMPYIEGEDLTTRLKREGRLKVPEVLAIARQVAGGLAAAHAAGVVHRDLKPANIMLGKDGNALIMDFGIARSAEPARDLAGSGGATQITGLDFTSGATIAGDGATMAGDGATMAGDGGTIGADGATMAGDATFAPSQRTRTGPMAGGASMAQGHIVGTVEYMAPEQARGGAVDQRADVYAFGMMLAEMVVGRRHPKGMTPIEALQHRLVEPPHSLRESDPEIPEDFDAVVLRCLQIDPAERYQTSAQVAQALNRLDDAGDTIPDPFFKRFAVPLSATALVLVAALVTGTWWVSRGSGVAVEHPPLSILISDFQNTTNDPSLDGTIEPALGIALEGASFINNYPRARARSLAAQLGRAEAGVNEETARLIATREDVNVILTGRIDASGSGYAINVRALDAADGKELQSLRGEAASKSDVLKVVSDLASDLRDQFGDTTPDSARKADVETFTAASLDAVREYTLAQDLASAGRDEEAIAHYQTALTADNRFGRAYSGLAVSAFKLGRADEAENAYKKAFDALDRMTEREKLRTLGAYHLQFTGNYDKAIENYGLLVKGYPVDRAGHSNLALAYFHKLDFAKARDEGQLAVQQYPRTPTFRSNFALFAMYAGDFAAAATEARKVLETDKNFYKGYLPIALEALSRGDLDAARTAYKEMAGTTPAGAALAASGLADTDLYGALYEAATANLRTAIASDEQSRRTGAAVAKYIALGEGLVERGRAADARKAAAAAEALSSSVAARVGAARIFLRAGAEADARRLGQQLGAQLQPEKRAYARILDAEIALSQKRPADAVDALTESRKHADLWLGRFDLGVAYVEAGAFAEAVSELDLAAKRRGEAVAMFLDDWPTARYLAPLEYWLGRAHEGLSGMSAARPHYETFLELRGADAKHPLVLDTRARLK